MVVAGQLHGPGGIHQAEAVGVAVDKARGVGFGGTLHGETVTVLEPQVHVVPDLGTPGQTIYGGGPDQDIVGVGPGQIRVD